MEFKKVYDNLIDEKQLENLSNFFVLDKKIVEILYSRGYTTKEEIEHFLYDNINDLKNPYLMINMEKIVERILLAIKKEEKILIFGDYDTDGIGAVSILYNYLKTKTNNVKTYLPNRLEDGYGLSCPCIDKIAEKEKPNLIITVDCGITCFQEIEYIKQMGIDVIVTDHHELPTKLPDCLILNPKLKQDYNFDGLCGAGVSFKLVQALCAHFNDDFEPYLPICAISTIADIVPLVDDNRIIVKEGLKRLELLPIGVKILLKNTFKDLKNISSTDIAFKMAPKLNSTGRLDDANISLNLFINSDMKVINNSLKQIEYFNDKRRKICDTIYEESKKMVTTNSEAIILYKEDWNIGVLGIVAAKLCDEFNKPTILFGKCSGELKGSARSVGNIDIVKLFTDCNSVLTKFGGHTKAGGLSLKEENLNKFKQLANFHLKKNYSTKDYEVIKEYDLELNLNDITIDFVEKLNILEPFGYKNNLPVFKVANTLCKTNKMKNYPQHLTISLNNQVNLISFNDVKNYENYLNFNVKEFLLELNINEFKGKKSVKGIVKQCKFYNPKKVLNIKLEASFFNQILYKNDDNLIKLRYFNSVKQLEEIIDDKTLIITYKTINDLKNHNFNNYSLFLVHNFSEKTLIYGLNSFEKLNSFNKIIFLEMPLSLGFITEIKKYTEAEIFIPNNNKFSLNIDYKLNREQLLDIYYKLIKGINKNIVCTDLYSYFEQLVLNFEFKYSYLQFYIAVKIFEQLKLIENIDENNIKFKHNKIKVNLEDSEIYKIIN